MFSRSDTTLRPSPSPAPLMGRHLRRSLLVSLALFKFATCSPAFGWPILFNACRFGLNSMHLSEREVLPNDDSSFYFSLMVSPSAVVRTIRVPIFKSSLTGLLCSNAAPNSIFKSATISCSLSPKESAKACKSSFFISIASTS